MTENKDSITVDGITFKRYSESKQRAGSTYFRAKVCGKTVYLHVYLWERDHGRKVPKGFVVHHINEDSSDNRPENFQLMTRTNHRKIHGYKRKHPGNPETLRQYPDAWKLSILSRANAPKVEVICLECKNSFKVAHSHAKTTKFCSPRCRTRFYRHNQ
ncbi:MAG: HNH endonuclease [Methanoregulaceae archaeon]|jgi:hypothetical protein|nr:HNH endonuclease [Methanoregulaceae archaeon]